MKTVRLQLVKHMVAATVFFGICSIVVQISMLVIGVPLPVLNLSPKETVEYHHWGGALSSVVALALAFYLSRKSLGAFDRFLDTRRRISRKDKDRLP